MLSSGPGLSAAERRARMVAEQIERRGIHDPAILSAMRQVPREWFVAPEYREFAYDDTPLPIPAGQTISQPYVVALMLSALHLQASDRVLEVGAGSGYAAALLSRIAAQVVTIERHAVLVNQARHRLADLGYNNVEVRLGDGTLGAPDLAPFDAIVVAAGGPVVPPALKEQLALHGRLVMPVGSRRHQQVLVRLRRLACDKFDEEELLPVAFVPLVGAAGWV